LNTRKESLSGREIKFARDIAGYLVPAQLALELFGRGSGGLHAWPGIVTTEVDIPVDLVEWSGSGGGLCNGFGEFGGMCWVREGEEVRMIKSLDISRSVREERLAEEGRGSANISGADPFPGLIDNALAQQIQGVCGCGGEQVTQRRPWKLPD